MTRLLTPLDLVRLPSRNSRKLQIFCDHSRCCINVFARPYARFGGPNSTGKLRVRGTFFPGTLVEYQRMNVSDVYCPPDFQ